MRGHGQNRHISEFSMLPNLSGGGQAIQLGQAQVHQNYRRMFLDSHGHRLFTVCSFDHAVAGHFEQPPHHEAAILEIFDHQEELFALHLGLLLNGFLVNENDVFTTISA